MIQLHKLFDRLPFNFEAAGRIEDCDAIPAQITLSAHDLAGINVEALQPYRAVRDEFDFNGPGQSPFYHRIDGDVGARCHGQKRSPDLTRFLITAGMFDASEEILDLADFDCLLSPRPMSRVVEGLEQSRLDQLRDGMAANAEQLCSSSIGDAAPNAIPKKADCSI